MRNLKTLAIIFGVVSCVLFFSGMTLLLTSITPIGEGDPAAIRAFLLGGKLVIVSMPVMCVFFWLEQKVTDRKYKELSQQGVPLNFL